MVEILIMQIIITGIGIVIFVASIFYNKENHKRFGDNASSSVTSDSLIATMIALLIAFILSIAPWWLTKFLFLAIGAGLVYIGIFLV